MTISFGLSKWSSASTLFARPCRKRECFTPRRLRCSPLASRGRLEPPFRHKMAGSSQPERTRFLSSEVASTSRRIDRTTDVSLGNEGGGLKFRGCHNTRRKKMLREQIAAWFAEHFAARLAEAAHPKPSTGIDTAQAARRQAEQDIKGLISDSEDEFSTMPGVKDLIEFSRSIHAEMTVLLNAARSAISPAETWLYCTTFPCHNCARHLVTAGVSRVYFIEPYVKSLAVDLHYDAIQT